MSRAVLVTLILCGAARAAPPTRAVALLNAAVVFIPEFTPSPPA